MYFEDNFSSASIFSVNVPKEHYNDEIAKKAMDAELELWEKYKVYKEVNDTGQNTLSTRWVVTDKGNNNIKARLVVRGFEKSESTSVDSHTVDKSSIRIFMSIANGKNWKIESMDIKAAFFQSSILNRDVFVKPPRNFKRQQLFGILKSQLMA